jgi:hypothetical protein
MDQNLMLLAGVCAAYLLIMLINPVRASLRDGLRCMNRYRSLWRIMAMFGLCYAIFQIGVGIFYHSMLSGADQTVYQWSRPWFFPGYLLVQILKSSVLPTIESVAGLFNNPITTFPFSAFAAILFLVNWEGHHAVFARALRHRFGGMGWMIHLGVILCAAAAIVKPALFGPCLILMNRVVPGLPLLQCSFVIDWLSFLFEYLFGVCVQIYLILMVYAWVRGLNFTHQHLLDFAIRRFSIVMKWSGVVMLLSTLFIHLPLILANIPPFSHWISPDLLPGYIDRVARPLLAYFLIAFSGVQIILTFHSETLSKALADYLHFIRKDAWAIAWYLLIAAIHFYFLNALNGTLNAGLGNYDTTEGFASIAIMIAWHLFYPILAAFVTGWMLASWVCLYKRSEAGRVRVENWIQY